MEIHHQAIIKSAYNQEIKFLYAVHHYQGLLDYNETNYYAKEEDARELFNLLIKGYKELIKDEGLEIYNESETELYFEGQETCHKIVLEAIIIPE